MSMYDTCIGMLLADRDFICRVRETFQTNPFRDPEDRFLFEKICEYSNAGGDVTAKTLWRVLKLEGCEARAGGVSRLIDLENHARNLSADWCLEELIKLYKIQCKREICHIASNETTDAETVLDQVEVVIAQTYFCSSTQEPADLSIVAKGIYNEMDYDDWIESNKRAHEDDRVPLMGPTTGLKEIDEITFGLAPSQLVLIGARPAMGKSEWLIHVIMSCISKGVTAVFYSLEMSPSEVLERIIGKIAGVNYTFARRGSINSVQLSKLKAARRKFDSEMSRYLILRGGREYTPSNIMSDTRRLKREKNIDVVFLDHVGILAEEKGSHNRYESTTKASRILKNIARSLKIPVWCACQLNREVASSGSHIPNAAHLRDSGSLEQDADYIFLLHRRDYYDPNDKPGQLEVITGKSRNGGARSIHYTFDYPSQSYTLLNPFTKELTVEMRDNFAGFVK